MKTIPFVANNDMWHDASVEVPDSSRTVLVANNRTIETDCRAGFSWLNGRTPEYWRELPAPPKPTPKIVPHSLAHWHDPKVERPEPGKPIVTIRNSLLPHPYDTRIQEVPWDVVLSWTYVPEYLR